MEKEMMDFILCISFAIIGIGFVLGLALAFIKIEKENDECIKKWKEGGKKNKLTIF